MSGLSSGILNLTSQGNPYVLSTPRHRDKDRIIHLCPILALEWRIRGTLSLTCLFVCWFINTLFSYYLDCIQRAPDLKLEILGFLLEIVDINCLRELRALSELRALWKRTSGCSLFETSPRRHMKFCKAVLDFHNVGRFRIHCSIRFANILVLQIHVFLKLQPLVNAFLPVLKLLRIEDLSLDCGDVSSFMTDAVQVWAPVLSNLKILRIFFNRFNHVSY